MAVLAPAYRPSPAAALCPWLSLHGCVMLWLSALTCPRWGGACEMRCTTCKCRVPCWLYPVGVVCLIGWLVSCGCYCRATVGCRATVVVVCRVVGCATVGCATVGCAPVVVCLVGCVLLLVVRSWCCCRMPVGCVLLVSCACCVPVVVVRSWC